MRTAREVREGSDSPEIHAREMVCTRFVPITGSCEPLRDSSHSKARPFLGGNLIVPGGSGIPTREMVYHRFGPGQLKWRTVENDRNFPSISRSPHAKRPDKRVVLQTDVETPTVGEDLICGFSTIINAPARDGTGECRQVNSGPVDGRFLTRARLDEGTGLASREISVSCAPKKEFAKLLDGQLGVWRAYNGNARGPLLRGTNKPTALRQFPRPLKEARPRGHQSGVARIRECSHFSMSSRLNRQSLPTRKAGSWPFLSNL
jgi:hypothetical protein